MNAKLHIITVIYNFINCKSRIELSKEFINKYINHPQIEIYVVELIYFNKGPNVIDKNNKNHLCVKSKSPLWHKENLINLAVEKLIPENANYISWIDGNIEFLNENFVDKIIESLQIYDVVQIFDVCKRDNYPYSESFGKCIDDMMKNNKKPTCVANFGHTGYGFAIKRECLNKIFPLPDKFIIGGGDAFFCFSFIGLNFYDLLIKFKINNESIKKYAQQYIDKVKGLKFGYAENEIIYFNHGSVQNRKYIDRWIILENYDPETDIEYNEYGAIEFIGNKKIQNDMIMYFYNRKEDEK